MGRDVNRKNTTDKGTLTFVFLILAGSCFLLHNTIPFVSASSIQNVTTSSTNKTAGTQINPTKFSTFQDPIYGIKVQYPFNWTKIEGVNYIEFQAPTLPSTSATSKNQLNAFEIRIDYLPPAINTLQKYTQIKLNTHRLAGGEFMLSTLNSTRISGQQPAYKAVYTNTFPATGAAVKTMEFTMIKSNNTGYDIRYFVDPASDYPKVLTSRTTND